MLRVAYVATYTALIFSAKNHGSNRTVVFACCLILNLFSNTLISFCDGDDAFRQINNGYVYVRVRSYESESTRRACA